MSLFRLSILLSCGVALMPSDKEQQAQIYEKASSAAYWAVTFCDRNEKTCDTAGTLWTTFVAKAEFAGRLGYDLAQHYYLNGAPVQPASLERPVTPVGEPAKVEKISAPERVSDGVGAGSAAETVEPSKGTLRADDLAPAWRGKSPSGA